MHMHMHVHAHMHTMHISTAPFKGIYCIFAPCTVVCTCAYA